MNSLKTKLEIITSETHQKDIPPGQHLRLVNVNKETPSVTNIRHFEVDAFRGLAVALMLMFHGLFTLRIFSRYESLKLTWVPKWYWDCMPEIIGGIFFLVVGISAALKFQRFSSAEGRYKSFSRQGVKLALVASIITLATAIFIPRMTVYFGTIHCIATITFIIYPFLRYSPIFNIKLGALITVLGFIIRDYCKVPFSWLLWLGFSPQNAQTGGDWYPLAPWFGVALLGVGLGNIYFKNFSAPNLVINLRNFIQNKIAFKILSRLGKHSLIIYLLHQPAFVAVYLLLGLIQFR